MRRADISLPRPWSLSPATVERGPFTERLVLPSPNGAAIYVAAAGLAVAGCLRNASAVADWVLRSGYETLDRPVVVVATTGERWPDGSLRPRLRTPSARAPSSTIFNGLGMRLSAEAIAVAGMYRHLEDLAATIRSCASARELQVTGYGHDVEDALGIDIDSRVPIDGCSFDGSATQWEPCRETRASRVRGL